MMIKNFDPNVCYHIQEKHEVNSKQDEQFIKKELTTNLKSKSNSNSSKFNKESNDPSTKISKKTINFFDDSIDKNYSDNEQNTEDNNLSANNNKANELESELKHYKYLMKAFDIIATTFIISGIIFSQLDNENYYNINIIQRNITLYLIHHSLNGDIIDFSSTFSKNYTNLTSNDCNYFPETKYNKTNYREIGCPLEIDDYCMVLRTLLLSTSLLSFLLLFISKYLEFKRDYEFKRSVKVSFFKTDLFPELLLEFLIVAPFQYYNLNYYMIIKALDNVIFLPATTCLSALTILRSFFIVKIFKNVNKYTTSHEVEKTCADFYVKANFSFAFKAAHKESTIYYLLFAFGFTCFIFGISVRSFELYYWETQPTVNQDWTSLWSAMWCIIVTMTTVGYGDFYPVTHVGRFLIVITYVIGSYLVSIMMNFFTEKSLLDQNEIKSYKLIRALQIRKEIKQKQGHMIYYVIKLKKYKVILKSEKLTDDEYNEKCGLAKSQIAKYIMEINQLNTQVDKLHFNVTKEQLFDLFEMITSDLKDLNNSIENMKNLAKTITCFSTNQLELLKQYKKINFTNKLIYEMIEEKKKFGLLNNAGQYNKNFKFDYYMQDKPNSSETNKIKNFELGSADGSFEEDSPMSNKKHGQVRVRSKSETQKFLPSFNHYNFLNQNMGVFKKEITIYDVNRKFPCAYKIVENNFDIKIRPTKKLLSSKSLTNRIDFTNSSTPFAFGKNLVKKESKRTSKTLDPLSNIRQAKHQLKDKDSREMSPITPFSKESNQTISSNNPILTSIQLLKNQQNNLNKNTKNVNNTKDVNESKDNKSKNNKTKIIKDKKYTNNAIFSKNIRKEIIDLKKVS